VLIGSGLSKQRKLAGIRAPKLVYSLVAHPSLRVEIICSSSLLPYPPWTYQGAFSDPCQRCETACYENAMLISPMFLQLASTILFPLSVESPNVYRAIEANSPSVCNNYRVFGEDQ
jgi:hypothetical protein